MPQQVTIKWHGRKVDDIIRDAVARGLLIGAEHLLTEANSLVPIDEGVLERSGNTSVDKTNYEAAVSYDTHYAVEQHENLNIPHAPGRQAKYLETPMRTEVKIIRQLIRRAVKRELG